MKDSELYALGGMTNSSNAMFERRRRILREARRIIAGEGLDALNIRDLCRRADVATRTIYNAFGSKENVVALAIRDYFDSFQNRLVFETDPASFEGAYEHLITTTLRNLEIPNFLRAVAALYFSPTIHANIRGVLVEIAGRSVRPWIAAMKAQRQLERGIDVERLIVDLSHAQYAIVHEWGLGALSDSEFVRRAVGVVLLHLAGALRVPARAQARAAYEDLQENGARSRRLLALARRRIGAARLSREKTLRAAV
ncbi:MAG: TetR/AcrR family transcriptional regulator [Hyphomonadaceae bacterium]